MSNAESLDQIMKRVREQLRVNAPASRDPAKQSTAGKSTTKLLEGIRPGSQAAAPAAKSPDGISDALSIGVNSSVIQTPFTLKLRETSQLHIEIGIAVAGTQKVGQINPRNPGLINRILQLVKKAMRRSLTWYTRPLHEHQGGVVRALAQVAAILDDHTGSLRNIEKELRSQVKTTEERWGRLAREKADFEQQSAAIEWRTGSLEESMRSLKLQAESLEQTGGGFEHRLDEAMKAVEEKLRDASLAHEDRTAAAMAGHAAKLAAEANSHSEQIARLFGEMEGLRSELVKSRAELHEVDIRGRLRDRDIRRTLNSLEVGPAPEVDTQHATPPMFASEIKSDKEFDYFAFEDLYRGDEADILSRQREYLEYFRGRSNVVDSGCGRGEFLELLRDNNISARGVELGLDQCLLCKEKGLDVVQQDLFEFLESQEDESLGGLFSAQVIEHFTASDQLRYVALVHRKTMPGSPVIFETINAQCVYAVMRNFFLDPTHIRPVHPETLKFAMETMQFKNVELRFSGPVSDKLIPPLKLNDDVPQLAEFNRSMQELNDLIYGYQDYAAIGWR